MDLDNNADIVVYDAGDSAVCTINMDANLRSGTSDGIFEAYCPSVVSLSASVYRVVVKPTTVVSMDVGWFTTASADLMGGAPGGTGIYYTQRTDGGSWTDTTTQRALMGLILSGAEDGAGGGGGEVSLPFVAFARP